MGPGAARWLDEGGHAVEESDEVRRREDLKFGRHELLGLELRLRHRVGHARRRHGQVEVLASGAGDSTTAPQGHRDADAYLPKINFGLVLKSFRG